MKETRRTMKALVKQDATNAVRCYHRGVNENENLQTSENQKWKTVPAVCGNKT